MVASALKSNFSAAHLLEDGVLAKNCGLMSHLFESEVIEIRIYAYTSKHGISKVRNSIESFTKIVECFLADRSAYVELKMAAFLSSWPAGYRKRSLEP